MAIGTSSVGRGDGRHGMTEAESAERAPSLAMVLGIAVLGAALFLSGHGGAYAASRAEILHKVCEAAVGGPGVEIVTDSDTECVFRTVIGKGSSTFYSYFSGDNFCERAIVITPDAPKYDQTVCRPLDEESLQPAFTRGKMLAELEGVEEAVRLIGEKVEYVEGTVQLVKDSGTMPVTADLPIEPGDVVLTGKTGFVEIISDGGATWLSGDSTYGLAEIGPKEKPRVIAPDEPLDPQSFQLEELSWWEKVGLYFAGTYNPDVYKTAGMYGFKKAHIVYRGAAYFEERTDGSAAPAMVVTPTAAIAPNGTVFLVEVENDGATTVTTLDGQVLVADLRSGNVVAVGLNQAVTVPRTAKGLSAKELQRGLVTVSLEPIDRWWFDKMTARNLRSAAEAAQAGERAVQADEAAIGLKKKIFFGSLAVVLIAGIVVNAALRSRRMSGKK